MIPFSDFGVTHN